MFPYLKMKSNEWEEIEYDEENKIKLKNIIDFMLNTVGINYDVISDKIILSQINNDTINYFQVLDDFSIKNISSDDETSIPDNYSKNIMSFSRKNDRERIDALKNLCNLLKDNNSEKHRDKKNKDKDKDKDKDKSDLEMLKEKLKK